MARARFPGSSQEVVSNCIFNPMDRYWLQLHPFHLDEEEKMFTQNMVASGD